MYKFTQNIKDKFNNMKKNKKSIKNVIIGSIILLVCIYSIYYLYKYFRRDNFTNIDSDSDNKPTVSSNAIDVKNMKVDVVKRPFLNLYAVKKDGSEIATNIVFITHSFTRDECETIYNDYKKKGYHFLGMSSYSEFPGPISNPHDALNDPKHKAYTYDYFKLTRGWCTVFREENNKKWIKEGFPRINLGESNFAKYKTHLPDPSVKKEYDFIYICLKDGERKADAKDCPIGWQGYLRRYEVAKKIIDIMCIKYKLKGLLIGRIGCEMPPSCHQLMELTDFQEYSTFIKNFNKCRFILTCSVEDASPRTMTEAMCFNLPILVNKKILGGWEYVNEQTGEFFDPDNIENGFEPVLDKFMKKLNNNEYTPREWYIKNYGEYNSGKKMLDFVKSIFKDDELNVNLSEIQYMKPGI